ncbi:biorientation of chromosomes in cell division protein 1-like 1 isoform X2 [Melanotaenia boesemani]|uniref:biorientation of chromosomes in cell division protein 1-like 1 isoform X2 n=1 Tax=Melanotaenia boesemani TaxID=1250792 RepID=UPI001C03F49E|nr:biorientation of chromosomes in cell division protein 1-like 1 isoform X2 [Melanotaenia boesemani]
MAGLPPGDPQLVSMIVNHLKTQGLFDQFRRDCLADVDTKPAYLNLKQRVDNFVSNHLSNHTWSPHLNKNQLRNNIRQLVLQSGMLEQGVDRIVTQVVDPKINHIFRPQVERVVREFLSPGSCSQEMPTPLPPAEIKSESIPEQASLSTPTTTAASDAMSILDTITSLNQEASVRASSATEKGPKGQATDDLVQLVEENVQDMNIVDEGDGSQEGKPLEETEEAKGTVEVQASEVKTEHTQEQIELDKEGSMEEIKMEEEESGAQEQTEEEKDRRTSKISGKPSEEKQDDDDALKSTSQAKQKARERIKEEYSLEDSDLEGLSDITVSSVHTSDLSSFEEESDEEEQPSDSSEEGELPPDDQAENAEKKPTSGDTGDEDKESKPRRKAYVHKPFLYSRYYSDSDDEITVEERRRSAAKEKEERLLKRQQNRERMEEKRKQKAAQTEEQDHQQQKITDSASLECPKAKEARKERKVLEKKMALNRKRKLDSRKGGEVSSKKKGNTGDITKKAEVKSSSSKTPQPKLMRNLSESASSDEKHRRMSGSISEDSSDTKKLSDKSRTHSFILDLEQGSQEALKQRSFGKFDRLSRKELHSKERKDKERSLSDERSKLKQKQEKKSEHQLDESQMKEGTAVKVSSEEKGEKKPKIKSEKKMAASTREGKMAEGVLDEGGFKDSKKTKGVSGETVKAEKEKDKIREKDKIKEKEKAKAEKSSFKSDFKQILRPDSAGSSEDRSDMEPGSDSSKKREKHSKEVLKRSKSHTEDRSGDKPRSKIDSEKDKTKADQDSQKLQKSSSETDKDPKRVKTTEKGKITEKPKVKSKEEAKVPLSLKTVKKVQSLDVKSAGGTGIIKPEATKEKKKDGNAKEQRRVTGEPPHEKSDLKSSKKKLEKKDKVPEKKDDSQEEKTIKEEKLEKPDKFSKASSVSLSLETDESLKKQPLLQETSTDSDPVTTTVTTSFSDDTCDALSDITPEPPECETESRLSEIPAVPAENDALLTLMDVCTSAEARLPPECLREEATPKTELQDADMKMKEAALTLLSMDPDSTMSSSLICQDTRDEAPLYPPDTKQVEASTAEEVVLLPLQVQPTHESELSASETCQQTVELIDVKPDTADESGRKMDTAETEMTEMAAPLIKEDDAALNTCQISPKEEETKSVETPPETLLREKMAAPVDQVAGAVKSDLEEAREGTEVNTASFSDTIEQVSEIPKQTEPDFEVRNLGALEAEDDENQIKMVVDKVGEAENKNEGENVPAEKGDLQTMETNIPNISEEGEAESTRKLVKQISNISSTDSQDDEKSSDLSAKEVKNDGRGRRKRKLSCQKGDKKDEMEGKEQLSAEDIEKEQVLEVKTTRRGRPPRTTEEAEKDQPKEAEKSEEPPSRRGRRSGAAAKETAADNQKEDENRAEDIADETSSLKAAEKEEKGENESKPEQIVQSGVEDNLPSSAPEDNEGAVSSDFQDMTDTCKPAMKRNRSEEMEESSEEETQAQEEMKDNRGQEQSTEQYEKDSVCSPSASQSEDVKEEICSENKPDDAEEEKQEEQQEDQEATLKKPARRGRPPKAAAMEDSGKKDKKADEKDSEQNYEEDEEEGEKEGDDKESATRATTRSASRLEAEKNKPSKPSTRASRQNGKEETTAGTRGTRGQAPSKGGRKREASPPAVRTRGGQKSEEPPSKRAKR